MAALNLNWSNHMKLEGIYYILNNLNESLNTTQVATFIEYFLFICEALWGPPPGPHGGSFEEGGDQCPG